MKESDRKKIISLEYERIYKLFDTADERKKSLLEGLILEAAKAKVNLQELNELANLTGLIRVDPKKPTRQKPTVVANEIVKYRNSYNHILSSLVKQLGDVDEDLLNEVATFSESMKIE